jgi:hypothetical protein
MAVGFDFKKTINTKKCRKINKNARGDSRRFLNFPEKGVVHEQNLDTWEFGKGALSEFRFCGVTVLQSERGKR